MRLSHVTRGVAAAMMLGGLSLATTVQAQDDSADNELSVGLYLGDCDNLVEGAALYDLGDAELETESFSDADENSDGSTPDADLEDEIDEESDGDETDPQGDSGDNSDEEVVVQGDQPLVWVAQDAAFSADLVDVVDAPFAIAVRSSADDSADDSDDFVACGEFGGAVAGDELIIPLIETENSGYAGVVILSQGGEGEASASTYLYNREMGQSEDESGAEDDATPTS